MDLHRITAEHEKLASLIAQGQSLDVELLSERVCEHVTAERDILERVLADDRLSPRRHRYDQGVDRLIQAATPPHSDSTEMDRAFQEHLRSCAPLLADVAGEDMESLPHHADGASDADESWSAQEPAQATGTDRSLEAVVERTQGGGRTGSEE